MYNIHYRVQELDEGYQIVRFTEFEELEQEDSGDLQSSEAMTEKDDITGVFAVGPEGTKRLGNVQPTKLLMVPVEEEGVFAVKAKALKRAQQLNKQSAPCGIYNAAMQGRA